MDPAWGRIWADRSGREAQPRRPCARQKPEHRGVGLIIEPERRCAHRDHDRAGQHDYHGDQPCPGADRDRVRQGRRGAGRPPPARRRLHGQSRGKAVHAVPRGHRLGFLAHCAAPPIDVSSARSATPGYPAREIRIPGSNRIGYRAAGQEFSGLGLGAFLAWQQPPEGDCGRCGRGLRAGHRLGGLMIHSTRAVAPLSLTTQCVEELRYSMLSPVSSSYSSSSRMSRIVPSSTSSSSCESP